MAAAAMDAALASLRSAMESLLEEKLAAALAEMEVLRADTSQLKLEQQALEKVASELRTENLRLRAEINEVRLRVGGVEAASTAPGSPARPDSTSPSSSEKDWDGADGSVRLPLSLRKAWYRNAVERVLSLELEAEQATKPSATGLEALEAKTETEDLWANWKPSGRDGRDRRQWLEDIVNRAVQVRATSVVHLRSEPTKDSMKNGSKLHEGAMAWSDAQVQVQGRHTLSLAIRLGAAASPEGPEHPSRRWTGTPTGAKTQIGDGTGRAQMAMAATALRNKPGPGRRKTATAARAGHGATGAEADPRFPFECARRLPAACSVLQTMTFKCTESQNSHDGLEPLKTPDGKAGGACAKLR